MYINILRFHPISNRKSITNKITIKGCITLRTSTLFCFYLRIQYKKQTKSPPTSHIQIHKYDKTMPICKYRNQIQLRGLRHISTHAKTIKNHFRFGRCVHFPFQLATIYYCVVFLMPWCQLFGCFFDSNMSAIKISYLNVKRPPLKNPCVSTI